MKMYEEHTQKKSNKIVWFQNITQFCIMVVSFIHMLLLQTVPSDCLLFQPVLFVKISKNSFLKFIANKKIAKHQKNLMNTNQTWKEKFLPKGKKLKKPWSTKKHFQQHAFLTIFCCYYYYDFPQDGCVFLLLYKSVDWLVYINF